MFSLRKLLLLRRFNPRSPKFIHNPYPVYAELRERMPVFKTPIGFWIVSKHEHVGALVKDRRFGKSFERRITAQHGADYLKEPAIRSLSQTMLVQDPPVDSRLRGLVTKAFTTKAIDALRPRVEQLANDLIDEVVGDGKMDVIREFAHKLPVNVICDMLGIPDDHRDRFMSGSKVSGRVIDPSPMSAEELAEANRRTEDSQTYFSSLFDLRRESPGDDLTSKLIAAEEAGDTLSDEELMANIMLLFAAGHETTTNLIGNGLLALHRQPDQLELMKRDEVNWPDAIEELLRYDSSMQLTTRRTTVPVTFGDVEIPVDQQIVGLLGAANRDPDVYADPDRLDLRRSGIRAMSFGGGIHICLGARLARLEGEVAFKTLIKRIPDLRLPQLDQPRWRDTFALRGLQALPAEW